MPQARLFPEALARPGEITINPWSYQSLGTALYATAQGSVAAAVWPAAGLVIYVPFGVPEALTVTKMFCGMSVASGNIDMGIYALDGTRLVSAGSTVAATTNGLQVIDVTDTVLARGAYYLAMVADTGATLTILRNSAAAGIGQSLGLLEQAGVTLPLSTGAAPATFARYTRAYIPVVGCQGYRTVGP